ncbi:MAG: NlpC/P60 family protein [Bacteroidota bacterium]|nr:NlpC/P60 family protein [Candidatus Kapabacteria bacterium]MDW8219355.1 NlpC/P60 family protein [Bacteroidota bacterium]
MLVVLTHNTSAMLHCIRIGGVMYRWKSTIWMIITGFVALFLLIPSLPLQAAIKLKKKKAAKYIKHKAKHKSKYKAKKKRYRPFCNTVQGRKQAFAFLQSSKVLAALAGLEYHPDPDLQRFIDADGEDLTDELDAYSFDIEDEEIEDDMAEDFAADINSFQKLWMSYMRHVHPEAVENQDNITQAGLRKNDIMAVIMDWIGTPYYYGGTRRTGIDCSAFTSVVHRTVAGMILPRTAANQASIGEPVPEGEKLEFGDLVFFHTRRAVYISHVGIYLGENLFAHASSRYGVTISSLQSEYYRKRFIGARRLRPSDIDELMPQRLGNVLLEHIPNSASYPHVRVPLRAYSLVNN